MGAVADYVITLLDEILGEEATREKRFCWAVGDRSERTGRQVRLPFDAVWQSRKLIVEVDEDQHRHPMAFWDKPDVRTVSGVSRGEQRHIYDDRKRRSARAQGYTVVDIPWERMPPPKMRDRDADRQLLGRLLHEAGVEP